MKILRSQSIFTKYFNMTGSRQREFVCYKNVGICQWWAYVHVLRVSPADVVHNEVSMPGPRIELFNRFVFNVFVFMLCFQILTNDELLPH